MEILLEHPGKIESFTTIFLSMKSITQSVNVHFNEDRMYVQTMDAARVSILEVTLPKEWFDAYSCSESVTIGVSTIAIHKILSTAKKDHSIRIKWERDTDSLDIIMTSTQENHRSFEQQFTCPLMDIEEEVMAIPTMEYHIEMTMSSLIFSSVIKQLREFGDCLDIRCNEEVNSWTAMAKENRESMSVNIKIDDIDEFVTDEGADLVLSFALNYLTYVSPYSKISKNVTVRLHSEFPLRLDYTLDNGGVIYYYLAPKVREDEG